jgi:hypothetical protein
MFQLYHSKCRYWVHCSHHTLWEIRNKYLEGTSQSVNIIPLNYFSTIVLI